jgi:hypothetical protein
MSTKIGPKVTDPREQLAKQRRRYAREMQVQTEKEHREAFSRPLISDALLTEEDRQATRKRVLNSGQRQWRSKAESL